MNHLSIPAFIPATSTPETTARSALHFRSRIEITCSYVVGQSGNLAHTDGRTDGRTDGQTDRQTDGQTDGPTDGWIDEQADGRTDGWTDMQRRTHARMDGQTGRRTIPEA